MKQRMAALVVLAGLMSAVASEEGAAPESPVSLRPADPIEAKAETKTEPKPDVKAEPKAEMKTEPKASPKAETAIGWDRYKVLVQRNMFSKERGKPRDETRIERKRDVPPPPRIEADLVLIGVVQRDGSPAAIIENRVSGKIVTVKPGDSMGAGTIKVISLDSVDFESDGLLHVIKIGSTLAGTAPKSITVSTPAESPASGTTSTTHAATGTPPATGTGAGGGESVLERMRRKRQEELRK